MAIDWDKPIEYHIGKRLGAEVGKDDNPWCPAQLVYTDGDMEHRRLVVVKPDAKVSSTFSGWFKDDCDTLRNVPEPPEELWGNVKRTECGTLYVSGHGYTTRAEAENASAIQRAVGPEYFVATVRVWPPQPSITDEQKATARNLLTKMKTYPPDNHWWLGTLTRLLEEIAGAK